MTVDVVCAGAPFLDIVFRGIPALPGVGEEVIASEAVIVPGAMANVAFALRQLGLDAVVCAPKGTDPAGRLLQELMVDAGIPWIGPPTDATALSIGLPAEGDRAFVTVTPDETVDPAAIAALHPQAIVINLPLPAPIPGDAAVYGVIGDPQVAVLRERGLGSLAGLRALFANEREARNLTGLPDPAEAAGRLAAGGCLVVVTRGAEGAVAATTAGRTTHAAAVAVDAADTVGAGDLFTAAFVWADLLGRSADECLSVATTYASASLARPTRGQKGLALADLRAVLAATEAPLSWLQEV